MPKGCHGQLSAGRGQHGRLLLLLHTQGRRMLAVQLLLVLSKLLMIGLVDRIHLHCCRSGMMLKLMLMRRGHSRY